MWLYYTPDPEDPETQRARWFRYATVEDIQRWARFILDVLPEAIDRMLGEHLQVWQT